MKKPRDSLLESALGIAWHDLSTEASDRALIGQIVDRLLSAEKVVRRTVDIYARQAGDGTVHCTPSSIAAAMKSAVRHGRRYPSSLKKPAIGKQATRPASAEELNAVDQLEGIGKMCSPGPGESVLQAVERWLRDRREARELVWAAASESTVAAIRRALNEARAGDALRNPDGKLRIYGSRIAAATGVELDQLGALVGAQRLVMNDARFRDCVRVAAMVRGVYYSGSPPDYAGTRLVPAAPIPMRLPCPSCGKLHVDAGEFAKRAHHTHACQHCGGVWRPALVATVGVQFLPGFKDSEAAQ